MRVPTFVKSLAAYVVCAVLLLWQLLPRGYILTLDMVFTPRVPMPTQVTSSSLFEVFMHVMSLVMPVDVLQKIMLVGIVFLASFGMHQLFVLVVKKPKMVAAVSAALLYILNPFVYDRFMAGQYLVMLGYALLPWLMGRLIVLLRSPSRRHAITFGVVLALLGVVSIHLFALSLLLLSGAGIAGYFINKGAFKKHARFVASGVGVALLASCYWLVPFVLGKTSQSTYIASFGSADRTVFATGGGGFFGKLVQVLRMQGFWAERHNLYLLPQERFVLWPLAVALVCGMVVFGARQLYVKYPKNMQVVLIVLALVLLLAVGVLTDMLGSHVPLFTGFREPQKAVAFLALFYAFCTGFAVQTLASQTRKILQKVSYTGVLLPFMFAPTMLGGFDGQLVPRQYPADWQVVSDILKSTAKTGKVVFLPWHQYQRFGFAGRIIATPAKAYFGSRIVQSEDPEIGGVAPTQPGTLQEQIAKNKVQYILHAKDTLEPVVPIESVSGVHTIFQGESLELYRVGN